MVENNYATIKKVSNEETFFVLKTLDLNNKEECLSIEKACSRETSMRSKEDLVKFLTNYTCFGIFNGADMSLIGFIVFSTVANQAELIDLAIHPIQRRNGLGFLLMNESLKLLKQNNIKEVILEVEENNIGAINLYQKFNAEKIGVRKKYYQNKDNSKSDAIVYKITIL